MGKYYCSWGDEPYKVKKGGEAIFRKFLEEISLEGNSKKMNIDRNFYELLISKIILFKFLEEIHGARNNAIGQLRSAVVPYTISVLYSITEGDKKNSNTFDLSKLWSKEGLEDDLKVYFKELMVLINSLITDKRYAKSDDFGEYSKKKELWDAIFSSNELRNFLSTDNSIKILKKYSISKKELENKLKTSSKNKEVDYKTLKDNIEIHSKTADFYKKLNSLLWDKLSDNERNKISSITALIQKLEDLTPDLIKFENDLIQKIRINHSQVFDKIMIEENTTLENTFNYILKKYNSCVENGEDIISNFQKTGMIAKAKGIKYESVFNEIGKILKYGDPPTTKQIYYASFYVNSIS